MAMINRIAEALLVLSYSLSLPASSRVANQLVEAQP